jgi:hypothetical protein
MTVRSLCMSKKDVPIRTVEGLSRTDERYA